MSIRRRSLALAASVAALAVTGIATAQDVAARLVASGLSRPIYATHAPGDESRLFIIEKRGRIRILNLDNESLNSDYFLDIDSIVTGGTTTSSEQGLLGLAFHPDYQNNGYFYVYYTATAGSGDSYIRRYSRGADADHASTSGAVTIMSFDQPYTNHNGGFIEFGPDGYLYIFTGDGGSGGDPGNRAQDITNQKLGKILRIDVDNGTPYSIPADNPFAISPGDDEIFAYGLRNPWRCAFDRETGDLWIADVGQNAREEVNFVRADEISGLNFGWRCREGQSAYTSCGNSGPFFEPQIQYLHNNSGGYSITGGYPYRGCAMPELQGHYFYADYVLSNFWSALPQSNGSVSVTSRNSQLRTSTTGVSVNQVTSFGEDARGEMYIVSQSGRVFKIVPADGSESCDPPPANDDCSSAEVVAAGSTAFTTVEASDSGFGVPLSCSTVNGPDLYSDVWFSYEVPDNGFLTVGTCGSDFDTRLALYSEACPTSGSSATLACDDDVCGDDAEVTTLAIAGSRILIRVGSPNDGEQGSGTLAIAFEPLEDPCPEDLNGDGIVGGADIGLLLSDWGKNPGSAADLNDDGAVNGADIGLLLSKWGPC